MLTVANLVFGLGLCAFAAGAFSVLRMLARVRGAEALVHDPVAWLRAEGLAEVAGEPVLACMVKGRVRPSTMSTWTPVAIVVTPTVLHVESFFVLPGMRAVATRYRHEIHHLAVVDGSWAQDPLDQFVVASTPPERLIAALATTGWLAAPSSPVELVAEAEASGQMAKRVWRVRLALFIANGVAMLGLLIMMALTGRAWPLFAGTIALGLVTEVGVRVWLRTLER